MSNTLIVKENPNFVRDINSGAILNNNFAGYQEYLKNKALIEDVSNLKSEISLIKVLLESINNKLKLE